MTTTTPIAVGVAAALIIALPTAASAEPCLDTPAGLSANHVNEVPDGPVTVTCDVGVYLDQDVDVSGLQVDASTDDMPSRRYGIYVSGAAVDLDAVQVTSPDDYPRQFIGLAYRDGATGQVTDSSVTGAHRAGIIVRGAGTDVDVRRTDLVGVGPKDTGWAQNGLQVDQGANASVVDSLIEGHYWNKNDYVSSGLFAGNGTLNAHHNVVRNNDGNIILYTGGNKVAHNDVLVDIETTSPSGDDVEQYGILANGVENHIAQNTVTATSGDVGIYVYAGSSGTKLIRNEVRGWDVDVSDNGDDTKRPNPVSG